MLKCLRKCLKREESRRRHPGAWQQRLHMLWLEKKKGTSEISLETPTAESSLRSCFTCNYSGLWIRGASEASGYLHWTCLLCTLQFLEHSFNKHQMPGLLQTCLHSSVTSCHSSHYAQVSPFVEWNRKYHLPTFLIDSQWIIYIFSVHLVKTKKIQIMNSWRTHWVRTKMSK